MQKTKNPVATDGKHEVFVTSWTFSQFGFTPHVQMTVKGTQNVKATSGPMVKLTPSDARRLASALLTAAENIENGSA